MSTHQASKQLNGDGNSPSNSDSNCLTGQSEKLAAKWRRRPEAVRALVQLNLSSSYSANVSTISDDLLHVLAEHPNPDVSSFPRNGFADIADSAVARSIHALCLRRAVRLGVFHCNTLVNLHFRLGNPAGALHLFDRLPERNASSWNTAVSGCVRAGLFREAVDIFRQAREGGVRADGFVLASVVTACNRWGELVGQGLELHAFVVKAGLMKSVYVATALVHLYGGYGRVSDARRLYTEMPERNVVSWTALMVCFSTNGHPEEAVRAYQEMRREGVACNQNSFATVISSCGMLGNDKLGLQVVGHVVVSGLESEISVANSLITMFGNLERARDAEKIFDRMEDKDRISWNAIITLYSHDGMCEDSLRLFAAMCHANVSPDATTFSSLVAACTCVDHAKLGRGIHALGNKNGLDVFVSVKNTLINMYSMSNQYADAERLFYDMPKRDIISWNTMISAYAHSGQSFGALRLLAEMLREKKEANHVTFGSALAACSNAEALMDGRIIHSLVICAGLQQDLLVSNSLITMYSKCKAPREARYVFQMMLDHDVVSCNALIGGYVENEKQKEAIQVFTFMRESGIRINYITIVNILGAFSTPRELLMYGMPLHAHTISVGIESDEYVKNSLLTMYAKCGDLDSSIYIFNGLENKTVVSWNAMIASKAHNGQGEDAFKLFMEMQCAGIELDQFSLSAGLAASASLASIEEGQQLHSLIIKFAFDSNIHVINATMDMYSKCGKLDDMLKMLPEPIKRSQQSWNIMISGHARHGLFGIAEDTFQEMLAVGLKPDYVTFVSLLSACNHSGLVEKGLAYYKMMISEFGITPGIEHCVCIVDLLGRSGRLSEAERFIEDMEIEPNDLIWRSLLSSSRTHKDLDVGMRAAQRLLDLVPFDDSAYVLLSNAYATSGRWEDVDRLRTNMESINLKKRPACSWIKVKNQVNTFGIGDRSHPEAKHIYAKLEEISVMIKKLGYAVDTSFALHDTDEEQKEHNLWNHSEKLALAFGLMSMPEGSTIRVFKNIRACGDCHLVYKLASKAFGREIMLRDPYRFHHFAHGECSCSDYW